MSWITGPDVLPTTQRRVAPWSACGGGEAEIGRESLPGANLSFGSRMTGPTSQEFRANGDRWSVEDDLPHSK